MPAVERTVVEMTAVEMTAVDTVARELCVVRRGAMRRQGAPCGRPCQRVTDGAPVAEWPPHLEPDRRSDRKQTWSG